MLRPYLDRIRRMNLLKRRKWTLARHTVQVAVIFLIVSPLAGFSLFQGNLASASLMGLELSDPIVFLQVALASGVIVPAFAGSALLVVALYFILGGRTFCAWICPIYLITELADRIRQRIGTGERLFSLNLKGWVLALALVLAFISGGLAFEMVSPIGIFSRAIVFGAVGAVSFIFGILLIEMVFARRLWCRSLCPVGAFYALVGRFSPLRVRFSPASCNACGDCSATCPVEEVLTPCLEKKELLVRSGECTRCGSCIDSCSARALKMGAGYR